MALEDLGVLPEGERGVGGAPRAAAAQQRRAEAEVQRVDALERAQEEEARAEPPRAGTVREEGEQRDEHGRRAREQHSMYISTLMVQYK